MSSIGPQLPPHLAAKRKYEEEEETSEDQEAQIDAFKKTTKTPPRSPDSENKKRRVVGPSLPPAPLDERPSEPPNVESEESDSEDDDDFGPSLPTAAQSAIQSSTKWEDADSTDLDPGGQKPKRDEWMTIAPKQDDLAARLDPTKLRARGFNTGKGARGPNQGRSGPDSSWMETPEQKRKRLEDEVLGVTAKGGEIQAPSTSRVDEQNAAEEEEKARRIKEYNDKHRSKSLYSQHQKSQQKEKEDDPSKRAFDYEKDMAGGTRIGTAKRREMLNKASDFGSRFSKGSFL